VFQTRSYQVDFDPQPSRNNFPKKIVGKRHVIDMFYNNKGADALVKGDLQIAYKYFREATLLYPTFQSAWVNMGILYRKMGYFPQAEDAYQYAISLNEKSLTAWENLAHLYSFTDRTVQSQELFNWVETKRRNNPYYHLNLGEEQIERKNWDEALAHFRKALALDRSKHETYFGLARVYFEIGELKQSERYLKQARNNAKNLSIEGVYQDKLSFLQNR
ncbi:tetratricopeptide repeat protein, partial [Paraglaciecola sp.]|uniref:tetratricopeptide repeat protein n=1 Tax=Paraglaciecola sp. TaxID=1920173 RepID=UPI003EFAE05B